MPELFSDDGWDGSLEEEAVPAEEPTAEVAVADPPDETVEPDAAADDRPRDEKGRFVPREIDDEVAVDDPELQALLAKYKGDPLQALRAAAEAQRHVGSVHQEIGQLRQQMEDMANRQPQMVTPQTPVTQDLIDSNPAAATELAYTQQNQVALRAAFEAWKMEEPTDAALWYSQKQIEAVNQQWEERYSQLAQQVQPLQQQQADNVFAQGIRQLHAADPQVHDRIVEGAAHLPEEVAGALYTLLETGTPDQKLGAYKALAELTKAPASPATPDEVRAQAREAALEADRAIAEAAVVSATATRTEPAGKSAADVIGDEWAEAEKPFLDGWNIR